MRDILRRAQTIWLKNPEVCDLLVNHRQYGLNVSVHSPVRPPGAFAVGPTFFWNIAQVMRCAFACQTERVQLLRTPFHRPPQLRSMSQQCFCNPGIYANATRLGSNDVWHITIRKARRVTRRKPRLHSSDLSAHAAQCTHSGVPKHACRILRTLYPTTAGGHLYLFDRRSVRFFRKDGHNWRKKADGKTVRETHEKLKVPR